VWLDGLDVPMVLAMRANFFIDSPPPLTTRTDSDESTLSAAIGPTGQHSRHSPPRRYPWEAAYSALQALMGRSIAQIVPRQSSTPTPSPAVPR
jgi:gentisate 1,2-dioxygenase